MTTNVLDLRAEIATSDSRWSINLGGVIAFVDDTGFDKIYERNNFICLFAGNSFLIQKWKDYIDSDEVDLPDTEINGQAIAVSITDATTGSVLYECRQASAYEYARFAGSGASAAEACWFKNCCAKTAIESASHTDCFTGGCVKFFSFDGNHNVDLSSHYSIISQALKTRGMVGSPGTELEFAL